jgi:hypothetical protein
MAQWDAERAEQWVRSQAQRTEVYEPATEKMLDLADLRPGNRVLDVAAGTGEQTLWLLNGLGRAATSWPRTFLPTCWRLPLTRSEGRA